MSQQKTRNPNARKADAKNRNKRSHRPSRPNNSNHANQVDLLKNTPEITFTIDNLLHDGRGVGIYTPDNSEHPQEKHGKKIFVSFALPNETVKVKVTNVKKSFEEGDSVEVISNPNPQRQPSICKHFGTCGGCSLQHWQAEGQIAFKESVLAEHLEHQADVQPDNWLPPIIGETLGYRTKARIGVRHLPEKNQRPAKTILGFRERSSNHLTDINECPIMDKRMGSQLTKIKALIHSLDTPDIISHLEMAIGEEVHADCESVAILIRHLKPISHNDRRKLSEFFHQKNWQLYLQGNKSPSSIKHVKNPLSSTDKPIKRLYYQLPEFDLTYEFFPTDFTQVNLSVNRKMVSLACELLDLKKGERVLDLFSGLGNFSLAMARMVGGEDGKDGLVIGVEGSNTMTQRAKDNAKCNGLSNTQFYTHDLTQDLSKTKWANPKTQTQTSNSGEVIGAFDALLIDPPRSGSWEIMQYIPNFNAKRIVYVSCNPATLARDSKALIEAGYRMTHAGVMDMFCHTGHVESIARFEKTE